ncbi:hypothetical protein [Actinomadura nitritigenes]|uniref:Secreted protein n=3 Tax=Actinomadura nitritigenes TaxID=134602 RepID=A0ABS3RFY7_9ACTN|nr:hypothetical protein [Actinomadura nitritigenes]MBO2444962.1 hypothetical protein [Actinomadura nitritigenes]
MRLRKAAVSAGLTILAVSGLSTTAQAAAPQIGGSSKFGPGPGWTLVDNYASRFECVDAGQQYEREGWKYICWDQAFTTQLWIK